MPKMRTRIAAERIEKGCDYEVSSGWIKLPLILSTSEFIETVDENSGVELSTLLDLVGNRFITRGHETIRFPEDDDDAEEYPLINNGFQIINNFVGLLPDTKVEKYRTEKKRRVFAQGGYKVLTVRGIRPITQQAPGLSRGSDALADMLDENDMTVSEWEQLYERSITRSGIRVTGLRAGVTDKDVHATRHVYGIRVRDEDLAYHISGVFNSLLFTMLQISWYGRIRFTANDVVSNLQLSSLKKAPMPTKDDNLADIQQEIEETYADTNTELDDRLDRLEDLQEQRERRVCKLYGATNDEGEPMDALLQEATTWQTFFERILNLTEEERPFETTRLGEY